MKSRLPTMAEAVEIVTMQISKSAQGQQLSYMRETQGDDFAQKVLAKVKAAGGVKKK
jgi:hypothetical protein